MPARPPARTPVTARIGPVSLHNRLDHPKISVSTSERTVKTTPPGEETITQQLGGDPKNATLRGTAFLRHANAFDLLTAGGPIEIRHDRPDAPSWAYVEKVSTSPLEWRPSRGQWGYEYQLELVGTPPPPSGAPTNPIPQAANVLPWYGQPDPRDRRSAKIGGITFPPRLRHPKVTVESTADLKIHDVLGRPSVVQYRGETNQHITIKGPCQRRQTRAISDLDGREIDVRTDRFVGTAAVESVDIAYEKLRYAPGQWGCQYTIELTYARGATG